MTLNLHCSVFDVMITVTTQVFSLILIKNKEINHNMSRIQQGLTDLAEVILSKANSIGLDVTIIQRTPGDGDCFYHSVLEGMAAKHMAEGMFSNAMELRQDVVTFVVNSWNDFQMPSFIDGWLNQHQVHERTYEYFLSIFQRQTKHAVGSHR